MGNKFRTRLVNASIRERTNTLSEIDIGDIFTEIIEDNGQALIEILKDIGKTSQGMRFLTLCQREDDLEKWTTFIEYESKKEGSKWNKKEVEKFYENLSGWQKSNEKPLIDHLLKNHPIYTQGAITIDEKEIMNWRLAALRKCLHNIIKGGCS